MMTSNDSSEAWVFLRADRVRDAVDQLSELTIPSFFIAYLHYRERAIQQQQLTHIKPEWARIRSSLYLSGGTEKKPNFKPFNEPGRGSSRWMNTNLSGSWAPRSTRSGSGARRVLEYRDGEEYRGRIDLHVDHAQRALDYLLDGTPVPALPWAIWWMRDYGFAAASTPEAEAHLVIHAFRVLFELDGSALAQTMNAAEDFDVLFGAPSPSDLTESFFEDAS